MSRPLLFWLLFVAWVVLIALSVIVPANTAATDFGMTRGFNRITVFFEFQIAAFFAALFAWGVSRGDDNALRRWLGRLPLFAALLLVLAVVGVIIWANMARTPAVAPSPDRPTAAPAMEVKPTEPASDG